MFVCVDFKIKSMPSISPNDVKITAFESQTSRQTWISIAWQSLFLALAHIVSADVLQCHSTQTTYSEQFLIKRSQIIHIFTMTNSFPPKKRRRNKIIATNNIWALINEFYGSIQWYPLQQVSLISFLAHAFRRWSKWLAIHWF